MSKSILDNAIQLGKETTYGEPAAITRAYEAKSDTWQREQEALESTGFRGGAHTLRSDRRIQINMGAAGEIEVDALTSGLGLLFDGFLGSTTEATVVDGVGTSVFESTSDASQTSYTVQKLITKNDGDQQAFTYHGSMVTEWNLTQDVGGLLVLKWSFDSEDEDKTTAPGIPTYPAEGVPYDWTQNCIEIDGEDFEAMSFNFTGNTGLKTDRRFLRCNELKRKPQRTSLPEYTGELTAEFPNTEQYDRFVSGAIFSIVAQWNGAKIDGATGEENNTHQIKLTLPACQYDGSTPTGALEDMTTQALPFKVLHNGVDPSVKIEYRSGDTGL